MQLEEADNLCRRLLFVELLINIDGAAWTSKLATEVTRLIVLYTLI